ncbi:hypothetical protein V8E36_009219 [Tilletia maclaganii]
MGPSDTSQRQHHNGSKTMLTTAIELRVKVQACRVRTNPTSAACTCHSPSLGRPYPPTNQIQHHILSILLAIGFQQLRRVVSLVAQTSGGLTYYAGKRQFGCASDKKQGDSRAWLRIMAGYRSS